MDLKQELIDRLGVPENWDKYDYQTQRYSFDDVQEVLEDIVKKLTIPAVVGRSEQFFAFTDWYFEKDKEIAEALRPEFEYWLKNKGK